MAAVAAVAMGGFRNHLPLALAFLAAPAVGGLDAHPCVVRGCIILVLWLWKVWWFQFSRYGGCDSSGCK